MAKRRLYIISLDAFGDSDLEFAKSLPNFRKVLKRSAQVTGVKSVYPSLTYMAHTSIATGMYPKNHGIINNTHFDPKRVNPDWYWYAKEIKTPTFFDVAKAAGYKTGALLWPVTGRSKAIDYNLAEIFPNRFWQSQLMVSAYASSFGYALEMDRRHGHLRKGIQQPELDDFVTAVAEDTILNRKPDLFAIHLVDLDSMRHRHGVQSKEAKEAIVRMDDRLGTILSAVERAGGAEETIIAILGDHYQLDTHTVLRPNHLFLGKGWITKDKKNRITNWKALVKAADGAAYVYRKDSSVSLDSMLASLSSLGARIERYYSTEEAAALGADPDCVLMLEAKSGYYFADDIVHPYMESTGKTVQRKLLRGSHGYHPDKPNYTTMLLLSGPGISPEARLTHARLVDEGPTLLHAIGLKYPYPTDGEVLTSLFV